jgi:plasmid stabilization system protein ParE
VHRELYWSERALQEYKDLLDYISGEWGEAIMNRVKSEFAQTLTRIQVSPEQFPVFLKKRKIRRCVASPQTSIYFKINKQDIEIYAVFDNRRKPKTLKL